MKKTETGRTVSYYDILQVSAKATDSDIRKAYYKLAKRFHPDQNPQERRLSELRFRLISEAYDHLKTNERRMQYDRLLKSGSAKPNFRNLRKQAKNDNYRDGIRPKSWYDLIGAFFNFSGKKSEIGQS